MPRNRSLRRGIVGAPGIDDQIIQEGRNRRTIRSPILDRIDGTGRVPRLRDRPVGSGRPQKKTGDVQHLRGVGTQSQHRETRSFSRPPAMGVTFSHPDCTVGVGLAPNSCLAAHGLSSRSVGTGRRFRRNGRFTQMLSVQIHPFPVHPCSYCSDGTGLPSVGNWGTPSPCPEGFSIWLCIYYGKNDAGGQVFGYWVLDIGYWRGHIDTTQYPIPYAGASSSGGFSSVSSFTARRWGKRITSRMVSLSVKSIASRSTPMPKPPVGGIP